MRRTAEWLIKRVDFSYEGRPWPLITHRALLICQDMTGVDMLSARLNNPSGAMLRALLFAALSTAGATTSSGRQVTPELVGKLIKRSTIADIRLKIADAWIASRADPQELAPEEEEEQDEDDPLGPEPPKPLTWLDAWSQASGELGLSDEEWLNMTPRQIEVEGTPT